MTGPVIAKSLKMSHPKRRKRTTWRELCDTTASRRHHRLGWIDESALSAERARKILDLAESAGLKGQSKINPAFTRQQVLELLKAGIPHDGKPVRNLTSRHIVREFRKEAKALATLHGGQ